HIDITAQKEAEREIQALNAGLEARIKARTAELEAEIAERRRLEEELRLFQAIIEAADEAIAISRPDGQLHYINPAHEQLFGFSLAEARARNYRDYYPPASLAILEGEVVPRLARGESWEGELEVQDRGGRRFPLWQRAGALCRADGALAFGFGFMHDISARKAAETALARQEAELRKLLAGLPIGVAIVGLPDDGKIQYLNDQFTATFGYTLEDVPTVEAWFVKAYPDGAYRQRVRRLWDEALRRAGERQGLVETHEYRIRCKDGGSRDTLISAVVLEGRLIATCVDLSAYHRLKKLAQLSEARYRLIAEHSRDNIWTMNLAGEFTYLSPSLESMLGYTPEEYQLLPPSKAFTPESYARVQEGLAEARARVAAGLPCEFEAELEHLTKVGSRYWSHEVAVAMYDHDGQFIEFMGISRDITQRKLQEEALRQAREAAEAANAAKSRFLATITHELRTPLHAIIGFTQVLAEREDEASSAPGAGGSRTERRGLRRRDLLAGIDRNGRHLLALVNDLLDLSRLESGHLKLRARPTALRSLLEECLADFSALAAHQGLELYLKFHPGLPVHVLIDPQRLRQILVNLLGNALKYTARGEITLTAGAVPSTTLPGRLALSFSVADTGSGIAPADQDLIFNPFGQENGGLTAGKPKGHGLGLAICRQLAALMGGEIRLDSVPGQGSRFTLWLPAVSLTNAGQGQADEAADGIAARAEPSGELAAPVSPGTPPVRSPASGSPTPAQAPVPP
ncbi:MAG: PAS domain S-box protein, partial [Gammaproteobacteria bacterium]|nr:PAS domain S-box protein [Gammaproteobacteria bacterium]